MATQVLMSLEQFHALPEKKGIEYQLLRGRLIEMSAPVFEHGVIQSSLSWLLWNHLKRSALDYMVATHTGFLVSPQTELAPDVCVIQRDMVSSLEVVRGA